MFRLPLALAATSLFCHTTGAAAQTHRIPVGDTVRVERAVLLSGDIDGGGIVVDQRGDTIVVRSLDGAEETSWLLTPTTRVSARRGREPWGIGSGVLAGGLVGGLAALATASVTRECTSYFDNFWQDYRENCQHSNVTPILVGGVVLGGVLGAVIRKDRWVELGSESVGLDVAVTPVRASLALRIHY